jgi:hypothetical protein
MLWEGLTAWPRAKGVLEESLPPLGVPAARAELATEG